MILLKSLVLITALTLATTQEINKNEHYDDQIAMESQYDDVQPNYAVLPKHIFNEGKPFLVGKDPVSGAINFNIKKLSLDNYKVKDDLLHKKDIDISLEHNQITPNFHDFLNLPVKYTSSNSVYPLVSSSYANLKYQGNNKNFTSNHKNFTTTTTTTSPSYFTNSKTSLKPTTTKLYPKHTIKTRPTTVKIAPTTTTMKSTTTQKLTTTTTKPTTQRGTTQKRYETLGTRQQFSPSTTTMKIISTTTPSIRPSNFPKDSLVHKFAQEVIEIETEKPIQNEIIPLEKKTTEKIYFTKPTTFKPLPTTTSSTPTTQIVDKNNPDTMSLSELLNSLAEDEKAQNFIPYGKKTTTTTRTTASTTTQQPTKKPIANENNYVKYEVQPPNFNMVQFPHKPVSSMNNIVISPDQNSATFVLGSQQSVGGGYLIGSSDKEINIQKQGTVINEPIQNPQGFTLPAKQEITDGASVVIQPSQEIHVDPNQIRFPAENEFHIPVITGTYNNNNKPIALPQQNSHVIFPPIPENNKQQSEQQGQHVVFNNNRPFPPKEILSMQSQPSYHQLPESLTPPMNEENFVRNDGSNLRPGFPRPTPSPYMFNKFTRQPNNPSLRPNPDGTLPNILPQFRPNAVGHGHGHHPYNNQGKEGNNRLHPGQTQDLPPPPHFRRVDNHHQQQQPNIRQPISGPQPPLPPQFNALRRQQNLNPNRFNNKMAPAPEHQIVESNRRYYQIRPAIDRVYGPPIGHQHIPASQQQQNSPPKRFVDGYAIQRQPQQPMQQQFPQQPIQQQFPQQPMQQQFPQQPMQQQYPQQPMQQQYPQQQPNFDETKPDLENEYLFRNPPQINQRPIDDSQQHKIEPVVTLQMIQSKKNLQHDSFNFTTTKLINEGHIPQSNEKNPLYVVYPVKSSPLKLDVISATESNGAVVIGQKGNQPPLPPSEIGMRNDYQNTPFTIIHNEQEPILMAKQNLKPIKPQFPYQLEKVDPLTVAELDRQSNFNKGLIKEFPVDTVFNIGEAPIDAIGKVLNKRPEIIKGEDIDNEDEYQISSTLTKVTRKPIAIAYTPTEPPPNRYYNHYGGPNFVSPANDKAPTESAYNHKNDKDENGYPSRGDHYEQDFQAPFFPSISIGGNQVTNSYEGWAVVTPQTSAYNSLNKNQINRSDEKIEPAQKESEFHDKLEITTKKFNLDSFQPEFESGFKPIFPDIKNDVQTRHSEVRDDSPTQTEKPIFVDDKKISSTSTTTTTTTTTTEKPVEKKKEIDSLEALFGLDDDYEYDDSTTTSS